ncbi:WYL domain-containing protein [Alkalinema sp. FACHB-956]|uniref:helix-turn-helix transcriptional regulator n=1 Tax=Alkalinema sp. FACHB-956 TaxID=2692768 RepID=UPI0016896708|nr:WYL domain-containing protein [Alkalinema sp. FACHB-956]MBD2329205.1 WYL domain-containing protein [Alkalinema sp. FACHB-956]
MTGKTRSINLSVTPQDKQKLEELAESLGQTWGGKPSISQLVKAIAQRKFLITPNNDWPTTRIQTLITAQQTLIDVGKIDEAQALAEFLLSRSELTLPQRTELQKFLDNPPPPWRQLLDRHIRSHTPFRLTYYDANEQPWSFSIRHAQINLIEKRQYLQCWCEEPDGNQDIPELAHNRTFRLDRIPEAAITPFKAKWKRDLDRIDVEFHVFRGLAGAYRSLDKNDKLEESLVAPVATKRIIRSITSTFWFFREILRYGEDCEIIAPESIRRQFAAKVRSLADRYPET